VPIFAHAKNENPGRRRQRIGSGRGGSRIDRCGIYSRSRSKRGKCARGAYGNFLTKPFEQAELVARCRALIRRATLANRGKLVMGRLTIDLNGRQLSIDGQGIDLTAREWTVFEHLARNSGKIVAKERLLQAIASWDNDVTLNAVEVYISRLRLKLGAAANIRTVRGLGYRLEEAK
jgi:two-component system, OmpR family, response regulator